MLPPVNKYAALFAAALAILSSAAVAGADKSDDGVIQEFEANGDHYYIHEDGIYKETNGWNDLQLEEYETYKDGQKHVVEPDKRADDLLAP